MASLLILGATGLVGGHLLRLALDDVRVERVVAPVRRALAMPHGAMASRLEAPVVDFDALPGDAPWWRVDAVACALGTTIRDAGSREAFRRVDVEYVVDAARRAREAGARSFALNSSAGANRASFGFYLRCKAEAEDAVAALGYPSYTIVRPSMIGGERARKRTLEHMAVRIGRACAPVIPARWRVVEAEAIARRLLDAAIEAAPGRHVVESEAI
ncbi:NAD(P)H-binding protein [Lysobacter brunescens]|uniref:NAD(P)H-binding protein n=1 Tax=Lysobacter brunescens TaxID=262323 RepID=A0ABW2YD63_9GAMM